MYIVAGRGKPTIPNLRQRNEIGLANEGIRCEDIENNIVDLDIFSIYISKGRINDAFRLLFNLIINYSMYNKAVTTC